MDIKIKQAFRLVFFVYNDNILYCLIIFLKNKKRKSDKIKLKKHIKTVNLSIIFIMKNKTVAFVFGLGIIIFMFCGLLFWVVYPIKYKEQIIQYSEEYNVPADLVASVICVESRFDSNATSTSGACGLMQLMPTTFNWVCNQMDIDIVENDIYNPTKNIMAGCYYLKYLFDKYTNIIYVLACYNAGEGVVGSWGDSVNFTINSIRYTETKNYVNKVLSLLRLYNSRLD